MAHPPTGVVIETGKKQTYPWCAEKRITLVPIRQSQILTVQLHSPFLVHLHC